MLENANKPVLEPKPTEQSNKPVLYPMPSEECRPPYIFLARQAPEHPGTGLIVFERPSQTDRAGAHKKTEELA